MIGSYSFGTEFRVKAEVHNDWGDKSFGYITLSKIFSPTVGDAKILCQSQFWKVNETIQIDLIGDWHNEDIEFMNLYIKIELLIDSNKRVLVIPEQWEKKSFKFILPIFKTKKSKEINIVVLITAINLFDQSVNILKSIIVDNTFNNTNLWPLFFDKNHSNKNFSEIVLFVAQMELIFSPQKQNSLNPIECESSVSCSNHGVCIPSQNLVICKWEENYSGIDWSIDSHTYVILGEAVDKLISSLVSIIFSISHSKRVNIESNLQVFILLFSQIINV